MSKVLVTGGRGFLGKHVCKELENRGYDVRACGHSRHSVFTKGKLGCNLLNSEQVELLLKTVQPDYIIHLAATVGGIGANAANPGLFFYDNMQMGMNIIHQAHLRTHIKNFVMASTVCAYPKHTPVPFKEEDLWNGYPEETNAPYGIAKKALVEMLKAYNDSYGFPSTTLTIVNLYGPGDDFSLDNSHVIPALIRKVAEAGRFGDLKMWGTGEATREFMYVSDAARGLVDALECNELGPINLGSGHEIKIKDLARMIQNLMGHRGMAVYDRSKPDGQPRRCLDVTKAYDVLGFESNIEIEEGLVETIKYYNKLRQPA